jgi:protein subunit release factor A
MGDQKIDNRERITIVSKKDLDISYYVGPGHGGQNKQKTHSGVQIIHKESGAIGRSSESRSQYDNKSKAFKSLFKSAKMQMWLAKKLYEIKNGEKLEAEIEKELADPSKVKYEIKENGKWKELDSSYFNNESNKI